MNLATLITTVNAIYTKQKALLKAVFKLGLLCAEVLIFTRATTMRPAPDQSAIGTALPGFSARYDAIRTEIEVAADALSTDQFN